MLKSQELRNKFIDIFSVLSANIKLSNKQQDFDINRECEIIFVKILNLVYDLNLINMNDDKYNYPAIDLGDKFQKVCFQITSDDSKTKINNTIEKFKKHKLYNEYTSLKFLFLTIDMIKRDDYCDENIQICFYDFSRLISDISIKDLERQKKILKILYDEMDFYNRLSENHDFLHPDSIFLFSENRYKKMVERGYIYHANNIDPDLLSNMQGNQELNAIEIMRYISDKNIYFTGDGGIGKTTLVSTIFSHLLNEKTKIPLYLHATSFPQNKDDWKQQDSLIEYWQYQLVFLISRNLATEFSHISEGDIAKQIEAEFEKEVLFKEYVLLIDGLNEVSHFTKNKICSQLRDLAPIWKNIQLLIFGRDTKDNELTKSNLFIHYELIGISKDMVIRYLGKKSIDSRNLHETLIETIKNPFFLQHFCKSYDKNQSRELLTKGDILDHYFSITSRQNIEYSELLIIEKLHTYDEHTAIEKKLVLGFVIPYVFFCFKNDGISRQSIEYIKTHIQEAVYYFIENNEKKANLVYYRYFSTIIESLSDYLFDISINEMKNIYGRDKMIKRLIDYFLSFFAVLNSYRQKEQIFLFPKHQYYIDYFSAKHIQTCMELAFQAHLEGKVEEVQEILAGISNIWNEEIIDFLGEVCHEQVYRPQFDVSEAIWIKKDTKSILESQFDLLRNCFENWTGEYVFNIIEVMKRFRKDLSGCDFSCLNLSLCNLSGVIFSHTDRNGISLPSNFTGSKIHNHGLAYFSHRGEIKDLFYLDENTIITIASDGCVKLWDCATGIAKQTLYGIKAYKLCLRLSNDGFVTCNGNDGCIYEWTLDDGRLLSKIFVHQSTIKSICLNKNETKILSGSKDGKVCLTDLASKSIQNVGKHNGVVESVFFSDDESKIFSCGDDGLKCWDASSLTRIFFQPKRKNMLYAQFSYDHYILLTEYVSHQDKKSETYNSNLEKCLISLVFQDESDEIRVLGYVEPLDERGIKSIIPDRTYSKALAIYQEGLLVLDMKKPDCFLVCNKIQMKESEHTDRGKSVINYADGSDGFGIYMRGSSITWLGNKKSMPIQISKTAFSPSTAKIVTAFDSHYSFCEWDASTYSKIKTFPPKVDEWYQSYRNTVFIEYAVYSKKGNYIWMITNRGEIKKFDLNTGHYIFSHVINIRSIRQFECSANDVLFIVGLSPNQEKIVISFDPISFAEYRYDDSNTYFLKDVSFHISNQINGILLSTDGNTLYLIFSYSRIHGYDTKTHELVYSYESDNILHHRCHISHMSTPSICIITTNAKYNDILYDESKNTFAFLDGCVITKIDTSNNETFSLFFQNEKKENEIAFNFTGAFINGNYKSLLTHIEYSVKNDLFIVSDLNDTIYFISLERKQIVKQYTNKNDILDFVISPDEDTILLYSKHMITELPMKSKTDISTEYNDIDIKSVTFSPDQSKYIILTKQGEIIEIHFDSGAIICRIPFDENLNLIGCDFKNCQASTMQLLLLNMVGAVTGDELCQKEYNLTVKEIGFAYQNMLVREKPEKAEKYFNELVCADPIYAYLLKGEIYNKGEYQQEIDINIAEQCYLEAILHGSEEAKSLLAYIYISKERKDYQKAHQLFLNSIMFADSCYGLGYIYWNSLGLKKSDKLEALRWYEKAFELGSVSAHKKLIEIYSDVKTMFYNPSKLVGLYDGHESHESMIFLGDSFYQGRFCEQDYAKAFEYYRIAAELDDYDISVRMRLGNMFLLDRGIEKTSMENRIKLAKNWLKQAYDIIKNKINGNDLRYCYHLAWFYEHDIFNERDYEYAYKLYKTAYDAGEIGSISEMSRYYKDGLGVPQNMEKAVELLKSEGANEMKLCQLAIYYLDEHFRQRNENISFIYLTEAAKSNDPNVLFHLGNYYLFGIGTPQNAEVAKNIYARSAGLGDNRSRMMLKYFDEKVVAVLGDMCAEDHLCLGILFYDNSEVERNDIKSLMHLTFAAEYHEPEAYTYLGKIYIEGRADKIDVQYAIDCFQNGIQYRSAESARLLAMLYHEGDLIQKDLHAAYKYYHIAQQNGAPRLERIISDLERQI